MTTLPKLTKRQQEILKLLYRFRFLNRIQIQTFLGHKDYKTINLWLRDLREKQCIDWIYSTHYAERTKPAVYYLGLNSIRQLRQLTRTNEDGERQLAYPVAELRKRYRESTRSQTYIDRCLLLADCCVRLEQQNRSGVDNADGRITYFYQTEADYLCDSSYYHLILDGELIRPNLIFCKGKYDEQSEGEETLESYILEVFDPTLPRYRIKKRLDNYMQFLEEENYTWKEETNTEKLPVILFVCPGTSDLIYAKRRTRWLIAKALEWEDDDVERPRMRFATEEKLKAEGVRAKIWEEA